jgi:hypothetical protein
MTDRPILFSGPMVRALLDGRKTQTRRVIKGVQRNNCLTVRKPTKTKTGIEAHVIDAGEHGLLPYAPGDRLWVRETWRPHYLGDGIWDLDVSYAADGERRRINDGEFGEKDWTRPKAADRGNVSPLFMPRWASRLTLTVNEVRVHRLQEMSDADAVAEGVEMESADPPFYYVPGIWPHSITAVGIEEPGGRHAARSFAKLWDSLNAHRAPWDSNPWVVALTFAVQPCNIDQMEA